MSYRPLMCSLCIALLRGPPIGGQDRDGASYRCYAPYTLSRFAGLPLKGKRGIWREKQGVIYFMYHSGVPPFVAGATTFPPQVGALWVLSHGAMSLQESIE